MRKITLLMLTAMLILVSSSAMADAGSKTFGKGISAPDTVLVSDVLSHPDAYVGKTIRVTGTAVGVCKHRGCWISLASDKEGETLRVKVKDGEIVFPPEIVGETVTAEGVWTANQISLKPAEEKHKSHDGKEKTACSASDEASCKTVYQLSGIGAVVVGK